MHTAEFNQLLMSSWPGFLIGGISALLTHLLIRRQIDLQTIRLHLGSQIMRFQGVPPKRLDAAIGSAAQGVRSGWRSVCFVLGWTLFWGGGVLTIQLLHAKFPSVPGWLFFMGMGLLFLGVWILESRLEVYAILRRLESLQHQSPKA